MPNKIDPAPAYDASTVPLKGEAAARFAGAAGKRNE